MKGCYQRKSNDCGVAALATFLDLSYEVIEEAWYNELKRPPGLSNGCELIRVAKSLGFELKRHIKLVSKCIARVRPYQGCSKSHWVVIDGELLWCPELGEHLKSGYPWQHFTNCFSK